jgi:hypothetical protein
LFQSSFINSFSFFFLSILRFLCLPIIIFVLFIRHILFFLSLSLALVYHSGLLILFVNFCPSIFCRFMRHLCRYRFVFFLVFVSRYLFLVFFSGFIGVNIVIVLPFFPLLYVTCSSILFLSLSLGLSFFIHFFLLFHFFIVNFILICLVHRSSLYIIFSISLS